MVSASPGRSKSVTAAAFLPERLSLTQLREAVQRCRGCELYRNATQAVFGEGARRAAVMLVGETPGDKEDLAGRPFVGPAGRLLDEALAQAGIDRAQAYVTNAVKHFKWTARGKRRIHQKPSWSEQVACRPWLEAELAVVRPRVLVCLGATAAQSLLGREFRVTRHRGELLESDLAEFVTATIHPSVILRQRDDESRTRELNAFVDDLRVVARLI
jgi:uracil-DNA glycosylase